MEQHVITVAPVFHRQQTNTIGYRLDPEAVNRGNPVVAEQDRRMKKYASSARPSFRKDVVNPAASFHQHAVDLASPQFGQHLPE